MSDSSNVSHATAPGRGRRRSRSLTTTAALALAAGTAWAGAAPGVAMPRSFPAVSDGAHPGAIVAGADGNLWFTEHLHNRIGRVTPRGAIAEFPVGPDRDYGPAGIAAGPDGNLWFTDSSRRGIGRITPTGAVTRFSAGISAGGSPTGIAAGPDGNLWFTEFNREGLAGNRIGRITPAGVVTEFSAGMSEGSAPNGIVSGPDGNLWFTQFDGQRIGRITTAGIISEFPPTAAILAIRLREGARAVAVELSCPSGAARACRGTVRLSLGAPAPSGLRPRVRRIRIAPGRRARLVFPLPPAGLRQLAVHGRVAVGVRIVPSRHSQAGSIQGGAILRPPRPAAG